MKNKVLIELYIVEIGQSYDLYIPVNEYIGKITDYIIDSAFELSDNFPSKKDYYLINPSTGVVYNNNDVVRDTDIKNAKRVFLI